MILRAIAERLKRRSKDDFKGRHFQASLIVQAVSWYLRYPLSYRDIEELFLERGLAVDHATLNRRSRQTRRRSSSCGVGALAIEHTRGSPRLKAIRVRTRVSPSIRAVFARRARREVRVQAGPTAWAPIPPDRRPP